MLYVHVRSLYVFEISIETCAPIDCLALSLTRRPLPKAYGHSDSLHSDNRGHRVEGHPLLVLQPESIGVGSEARGDQTPSLSSLECVMK